MADPIREAQSLLLAEIKKGKAEWDEKRLQELKEFLRLTKAPGRYAANIALA